MLALVAALSRLLRWGGRVLRPTPGWRAIVVAYARGQREWPVPGRPDARTCVPWPAEWCLVEPVPASHPDPRAFVELPPAPSAPSGTLTQHTKGGYRCARCGSPLAPADLALKEPPACALCSVLVALATRDRE